MPENVGGIEYTVDIDTTPLENGGQKISVILNTFERKIKDTDQATNKFSDTLKPIAGLVAAAFSAAAVQKFFEKLVNVQRTFDQLNSGLVTATRSQEGAATAFKALQQFAATTPYDLKQTVEAFTQLVNLGLNPSERALRSYGNTASAMGKDLKQFVEAVADAAVGEFERLKEFGIKASAQGNQVAFTFRGTTTKVAKDAAAIEEYLTKIGETDFAGAMQARAKTLDGAMSNLGDTFDSLFLTISQTGIGDIIAEGVRAATDVLQELIDMMASGELQDDIRSVTVAFDAFGQDVDRTLEIIVSQFSTVFKDSVRAEGESAVAFLAKAFRDLPQNVRAAIQIIATEISYLVDVGKAVGGALLESLNPTRLLEGRTLSDVARDALNSIAAANSARKDSVAAIVAELDATNALADQNRNLARLKREQYDLDRQREKLNTKDRLAQFGIKKGPAAPDEQAAKKAAATREQGLRFIEALRAAMLTSIEKIDAEEQKALAEAERRYRKDQITAAEYEEAKTLIALKAVQDRDEERQKAYQKELADRAKQLKALRDLEALSAEADKADQSLSRQGAPGVTPADPQVAYEDAAAAAIQAQQAKNDELDRLRAEDLISEQEYQQGLQAAALIATSALRDASDERAQAEFNNQQMMLSNSADFFQSSADLIEGFGGKASAAYRTLFALSKGFAIAEGLLNLAHSVSNASKSAPFPYNIAAIAGAAAQGASLISQIRSVQYSGGRQFGGPVTAGNMYQVNETGSPEMLVDNAGRQYMIPNRAGSVVPADGIGGSVQVIINNNASGVDVTQTTSDDGRVIEIAVNRAVNEVAAQFRTNAGPVWAAARGSTNISGKV